MAGWAGSDPAEGRTPEAECQWWADRLGNRQAEGGSAHASRLFYSPEAESSGERFRPWGAARLQRTSRQRRIPALLPKEDCRVLAYRHVPPCCKGSINPAGSGAQGAADRPYPPRRPPRTAPPAGAGWGGIGGWRRRTLAGGLVRALPTSPPPPRGSFSPAPAAGGGGRRRGRRPLPWGGGMAGRQGESGRWPASQAGKVRCRHG
jgi:hypothetical protein